MRTRPQPTQQTRTMHHGPYRIGLCSMFEGREPGHTHIPCSKRGHQRQGPCRIDATRVVRTGCVHREHIPCRIGLCSLFKGGAPGRCCVSGLIGVPMPAAPSSQTLHSPSGNPHSPPRPPSPPPPPASRFLPS